MQFLFSHVLKRSWTFDVHEEHNDPIIYSMCSLAVSTQDSPAVEPRSNPGSGKILMSENLRLYTTSPVVMC